MPIHVDEGQKNIFSITRVVYFILYVIHQDDKSEKACFNSIFYFSLNKKQNFMREEKRPTKRIRLPIYS